MPTDNASYWDAQARDNALWHIAHSEDEAQFRESAQKTYQRILAPHLTKLEDGSRVLDIGCGIGRVVEPISANHPHLTVFGVDVSAEMVRRGVERLGRRPNAVLLQNNGLDMRMFADSYFDLVYSYIVFQHLPTRVVESYVTDVKRVLRPGGHFIYQVQAFLEPVAGKKPADDDFRTIRQYTPSQARAFVRDGFTIIDSTPDKSCHDYVVHATRDA